MLWLLWLSSCSPHFKPWKLWQRYPPCCRQAWISKWFKVFRSVPKFNCFGCFWTKSCTIWMNKPPEVLRKMISCAMSVHERLQSFGGIYILFITVLFDTKARQMFRKHCIATKSYIHRNRMFTFQPGNDVVIPRFCSLEWFLYDSKCLYDPLIEPYMPKNSAHIQQGRITWPVRILAGLLLLLALPRHEPYCLTRVNCHQNEQSKQPRTDATWTRLSKSQGRWATRLFLSLFLGLQGLLGFRHC